MLTSFMWARWGMLMVRARSGGFISQSMEERIGRGFSTWGRRSGFPIWQFALPRRRFCLPALGIRTARPGALMPRSTDRAADFTVLRMQGKPGRAWKETDCLVAIGDAWAWTCLRTASAYTLSFLFRLRRRFRLILGLNSRVRRRWRNQDFIDRTMVGTRGHWLIPMPVSRGGRG